MKLKERDITGEQEKPNERVTLYKQTDVEEGY